MRLGLRLGLIVVQFKVSESSVAGNWLYAPESR